jgi:hypothetical protein
MLKNLTTSFSFVLFAFIALLYCPVISSADDLPILAGVDQDAYYELSDEHLSKIYAKGSTVYIIESSPYKSLSFSLYFGSQYINTAQALLMTDNIIGTSYTLDDGVLAIRAAGAAAPVSFIIKPGTQEIIFKDQRYTYFWPSASYFTAMTTTPPGGYKQVGSFLAGMSFMMSPGVYKTQLLPLAVAFEPLDPSHAGEYIYSVNTAVTGGGDYTTGSSYSVSFPGIPNSSGIINPFVPNSNTPYIP